MDAGSKTVFWYWNAKPSIKLAPRYSEKMVTVSFTKILAWYCAVTYDKFIAPRLDMGIWKSISGVAQGNDRPGVSNEGTYPEPHSLLAGTPPIMSPFTLELKELAEDAIGSRIPQLRTNIMDALLSSAGGFIFTKILSVLDGDQLVHCLYFVGDKLAEVIAAHIHHEACGRSSPNAKEFTADNETNEYVLNFKTHVEHCLSDKN